MEKNSKSKRKSEYDRWYDNFYSGSFYNSDVYYPGYTAWNGCKNRIKKLLESHLDNGCDNYYLIKDIIKEIENL